VPVGAEVFKQARLRPNNPNVEIFWKKEDEFEGKN
jgi:hypothetical protein